MGEQDRALIEEFKRHLPIDLVPHIRHMIMYGSRARGDAGQDSDLDLVALVDENSPVLGQRLDEIAYNLMWDHDFKPIISLRDSENTDIPFLICRGEASFICFARL